LGAAIILLVAAVSSGRGQESVVGSPHDLSVAGPGQIHALFEEQVCIFCHAPHNATGQAPLWNRHLPPTHYRIYESSSMKASVDQPSGPSKMCLSCHDGSLALGLLASRPPNDPVVMSTRSIPPGPSNLTQDLADDHPIGFRYDRTLAARDRQLKNPDVVTPDLPLGAHREMHCTTCHDAHDNSLGDFLRVPDVRSTICVACHEMIGWPISAHAVAPVPVHGRAVDPREQLPYATVADNGCLICHKVHSAGQPQRLLRFRPQEANCLNCHDGVVSPRNIRSELLKRSVHPVWLSDRHDPAERTRLAPRHVECADCHNPHAVLPVSVSRGDSQGRSRGEVGPTMAFVSGVNRSGLPVEYAFFEYEVCFKCHAESRLSLIRPEIGRQIMQNNTRLEFQVGNPSFHPVIGPRNNPDVVSLLPPWQVGSIVKCTDCHNSDQAASGSVFGVAGPHGSIYSPILIDNYETDDFTSESARAYGLCYRCHARESILGDQSFPLHSVHVVTARTPCSACHDAHGISRVQGGPRQHSNLINFDTSIVQGVAGATGRGIVFEDRGLYSGSCTLACHGVTHVNFEYGR
jgi:predicted CXXCH cytochrome family protein